jgi:hypothetical protein
MRSKRRFDRRLPADRDAAMEVYSNLGSGTSSTRASPAMVATKTVRVGERQEVDSVMTPVELPSEVFPRVFMVEPPRTQEEGGVGGHLQGRDAQGQGIGHAQ